MFERPGKQQKRKQMKGVKSFVSSIVEYLFEKGKMKRRVKLKTNITAAGDSRCEAAGARLSLVV